MMLRSTAVGIPALPAEWVGRKARPAHVHLTAAGAGPLGGDQLALDVQVGAGSSLILGEVSPTLLLPGPHGAESAAASISRSERVRRCCGCPNW